MKIVSVSFNSFKKRIIAWSFCRFKRYLIGVKSDKIPLKSAEAPSYDSLLETIKRDANYFHFYDKGTDETFQTKIKETIRDIEDRFGPKPSKEELQKLCENLWELSKNGPMSQEEFLGKAKAAE